MRAASSSAPGRARVVCRGAVAVEFALVASVLCTLLIGTLEFGRLNWYWVTAVEMTRLGARMAIVCDQNDTNIKQRMVDRLPLLAATDISVSYAPAGCTVADCLYATVSIAPTTFTTFIPFVPLSLTMPPFTTTLPRESMQSALSGTPNPTCQ
jgi:Flp pilus assembly protein TadG